VTVSTLLCMFLALWSFVLSPEKTGMVTALGIVGVAGSILMPFYGLYFYRKINRNHL